MTAGAGKPTASRCPSYATRKNVLSLTIGPPNDPPNWLLRNAFCGAGLALKKLRASSALLRKDSNNDPCKPFVPDFVTMLTIDPEFRPYSASVLFRTAI